MRMLTLFAAAVWTAHAQFAVLPHHEEIAERGRVLRYVIRTGSDTFRLNPPAGWVLETDSAGQKIAFRNERLGAVLSLRFAGKQEKVTAQLVEKGALERFRGAELVERFPCVARNAQGWCVELQVVGADNALYVARLGTIAFGEAQVELSLIVPKQEMAKAHGAWTSTLNSLARDTQLSRSPTPRFGG